MAIPKNSKLATVTVHAGSQIKQSSFVPTVPPIHHSTTYRYDTMNELDAIFEDNNQGYCYTRYGNPTTALFEEAIAHLENAEAAIAYSSGMAAIHGALISLSSHAASPIVVGKDIYGATYGLASNILESLGRPVHFVDVTDLPAVQELCAEIRPEILFFESVSNPLLRIADIHALRDISRECGAKLVIDNTFTSPVLLRPLEIGADVVIHSATKYLGGHGDALGGVLAANREIVSKCHETNKLVGATLGPNDAWLLLRGLRTLALRMREHCYNAEKLANWLSGHERVSRVYYPGLSSHDQHTLARSLFTEARYGGMVSFEIASAGKQEIFRFFEQLQICLPTTTLGDVTTSVLYPAHSSHRGVPAAVRQQVGIGEGLVRVSVGIEAAEDIIGDFDNALQNTPFK